MLEISVGLSYLHDEGVVHGDLRGANVLVDDDFHVRIADFGLSVYAEYGSGALGSMRGGNTRWLAPELIFPELYGTSSSRPTYASDVYAFGCVALELLTGKAPFSDMADYQLVGRIPQGLKPKKPVFPDDDRLSDVLESLWRTIVPCWEALSSNRPAISQLCEQLSLLVPMPPLAQTANQPTFPIPSSTPYATNTLTDPTPTPFTFAIDPRLPRMDPIDSDTTASSSSASITVASTLSNEPSIRTDSGSTSSRPATTSYSSRLPKIRFGFRRHPKFQANQPTPQPMPKPSRPAPPLTTYGTYQIPPPPALSYLQHSDSQIIVQGGLIQDGKRNRSENLRNEVGSVGASRAMYIHQSGPRQYGKKNEAIGIHNIIA